MVRSSDLIRWSFSFVRWVWVKIKDARDRRLSYTTAGFEQNKVEYAECYEELSIDQWNILLPKAWYLSQYACVRDGRFWDHRHTGHEHIAVGDQHALAFRVVGDPFDISGPVHVDSFQSSGSVALRDQQQLAVALHVFGIGADSLRVIAEVPFSYLIRPDGYVDFRGRGKDVDRLEAYVSRWFGNKSNRL